MIERSGELLATVPERVAEQIRSTRPRLRQLPLPFALPGAPVELLWPRATDDDEACKFARQAIVSIVEARR